MVEDQAGDKSGTSDRGDRSSHAESEHARDPGRERDARGDRDDLGRTTKHLCGFTTPGLLGAWLVVLRAGALLAAFSLAGGNAWAEGEKQTVMLGGTSSAAEDVSGLTLQALIDEAIAHNLQVAVAESSVGEARALYEYAASKAYPVLSATVLFGGPTPEAKTTVKNDPSTATEASFEGDFDFGQLGVGVRINANAFVPIYTFGKISNGKDAAEHVVEAAKHQVHATKAEVASDVGRAFWSIQLVRTFENSLADGEKTLEKVLKKVEDLLENDSPQVTENDRLRLLHALGTLRVRKIDAANAQTIATKALLLLIGRTQGSAIEVATVDLDEGLPEGIPNQETMIATVRAKRPELMALREVVEAQKSFADLRRAQFYPDLFIGGVLNYAYTSNATDQTNPFIEDTFNFFDLGIGIGVRVEVDIFGKLAQLEQAEAQARTRATQERLATEAAELDVRRIHTSIEGGLQRVAALERNARTARGWLTASVLAYDIGTGRADELIDSFLAWAASEAELQKTRYDTILRMTELARATGKLTAQ
jgi:outer membrane protein, multidrug efflux system